MEKELEEDLDRERTKNLGKEYQIKVRLTEEIERNLDAQLQTTTLSDVASV